MTLRTSEIIEADQELPQATITPTGNHKGETMAGGQDAGSVFIDAASGTQISCKDLEEHADSLSTILKRQGLEAGDTIVAVGSITVRY